MTFVDHDQIEEVGGELFVDVLLFISATDRLIKRQVDFIRLVDFSVFDLGHRRTKRLEVVGLCLINQNVAVGKEQNPLGLA